MKKLIREMDDNTVIKQPFWKRLGWLAMIWFGSVLALFAVASVFRLLMMAAGMHSH
jgi:cell division protein FtsB